MVFVENGERVEVLDAVGGFGSTIFGHNPPDLVANCRATLDRAVPLAAQEATRDGDKQTVVLLSPACASYDQFHDFEERGDAFRRIVAEVAA